jgi:hypothetical protein
MHICVTESTWLGDTPAPNSLNSRGFGDEYFTYTGACDVQDSAELKGSRRLLRIRPEIFDFEPGLGLKLRQTKPKISGTVPTNRHTTIPNDSGPISEWFDDDPKLLNCEIAQPSPPTDP